MNLGIESDQLAILLVICRATRSKLRTAKLHRSNKHKRLTQVRLLF